MWSFRALLRKQRRKILSRPDAIGISIAVLESDGARAVFDGKRYVLVPNCKFHVDLKFRSVDRRLALSLHDYSNDLEAVAAFAGGTKRITMMGAPYRNADKNAEILVFFTPAEECESERWQATETRGWPCKFSYEADEQTGVLKRCRLALYLPDLPQIERIADACRGPWTYNLILSVYLDGLYVPEGTDLINGWPSTDLAYLLPKGHWRSNTATVRGYASRLEVEQHLFGHK